MTNWENLRVENPRCRSWNRKCVTTCSGTPKQRPSCWCWAATDLITCMRQRHPNRLIYETAERWRHVVDRILSPGCHRQTGGLVDRLAQSGAPCKQNGTENWSLRNSAQKANNEWLSQSKTNMLCSAQMRLKPLQWSIQTFKQNFVIDRIKRSRAGRVLRSHLDQLLISDSTCRTAVTVEYFIR